MLCIHYLMNSIYSSIFIGHSSVINGIFFSRLMHWFLICQSNVVYSLVVFTFNVLKIYVLPVKLLNGCHFCSRREASNFERRALWGRHFWRWAESRSLADDCWSQWSVIRGRNPSSWRIIGKGDEEEQRRKMGIWDQPCFDSTQSESIKQAVRALCAAKALWAMRHELFATRHAKCTMRHAQARAHLVKVISASKTPCYLEL